MPKKPIVARPTVVQRSREEHVGRKFNFSGPRPSDTKKISDYPQRDRSYTQNVEIGDRHWLATHPNG